MLFLNLAGSPTFGEAGFRRANGDHGFGVRSEGLDFQNGSAVYNRLRRWIASGRLKRLFEEMAAQPACEGTVRVTIDSTIVRAHQHSAGAF